MAFSAHLQQLQQDIQDVVAALGEELLGHGPQALTGLDGAPRAASLQLLAPRRRRGDRQLAPVHDPAHRAAPATLPPAADALRTERVACVHACMHAPCQRYLITSLKYTMDDSASALHFIPERSQKDGVCHDDMGARQRCLRYTCVLEEVLFDA